MVGWLKSSLKENKEINRTLCPLTSFLSIKVVQRIISVINELFDCFALLLLPHVFLELCELY